MAQRPIFSKLLKNCLGHLTQAEEYLSQAQWIVLKTSDCSNDIQSKLHRNLGLLYAAKGHFEESLYHLATDIYLASCAFGTHDISTSGGYFHMANVFFRQNKMDIADSLYTEVTDIWHAHFSRLIQVQSQTLTSHLKCFILNVDEDQQAEASQVLNAILDIREQAPKQQPAKTARVVHALAMLHYLILDLPKASHPQYGANGEVLDLISVWGEEAVQSQLRSSCRNHNTFRQISRAMMERGHDRDALRG
uniref:Zinc finger MYND-type containing 12 n=1 Tax=Chelydra serpentina TaxID=8475 RepID=A0A8C3T2C1_CHESE